MRVLDKIYQHAGRPGLEVESNLIHWIPYKYKYSEKK